MTDLLHQKLFDRLRESISAGHTCILYTTQLPKQTLLDRPTDHFELDPLNPQDASIHFLHNAYATSTVVLLYGAGRPIRQNI